jgi:hypothetical protein
MFAVFEKSVESVESAEESFVKVKVGNEAEQNVPVEQTVVLNDSEKNEKTQQGKKVVSFSIEQLVEEREVWQSNAFRTSNEQLYSILQKCYGMYKAMEKGSEAAGALRAGLENYINTRGYKFSQGTHTLTRIVKCVFGNDRRRVSAYGIVLRAALAKGVGVFEVADFIREAGGVEEIRLAKSPNSMSVRNKAEVVKETVSQKSIGVFSSKLLHSLMGDAGKVGKNTVLVGMWQADGSIVVRAVVESQTVLTAALASYYSKLGETSKLAVEEKKAETANCVKKEAIISAVETAKIDD